MDVNSIRDAFDRVVKKQKLSYSKTQEAIDQFSQEISDSIEKIRSAHNSDSHSDYKTLLADLKTKIKEMAPLTLLEGSQKELNVALSKYPKLLEKSFNPDISKAYRNVDLDTATINYVIASHFYRQGLFDVGDCFVTEAMEPESIASIRSPYVEMYQILEAMKSRNLEPALKWATSNCSKLKANGSDLEVKLHRMQFVEILQRGNRDEALKYARSHLAPFASDHLVEIQKLMGCLLWAGRLEQSPYPDLLSAANWDKLAEELTRQSCSFATTFKVHERDVGKEARVAVNEAIAGSG
ncbi:protein RMD5 homolog [Rhodamnia argentea]|uniref:Protein RMD5 homolog n=1 Tax=Rhodamnia argentea TaxID=178133 RepID=A0ABM3H8C7_9MYRT|nr:protein RMD5 homolog [Rhodamnia argentea]